MEELTKLLASRRAHKSQVEAEDRRQDERHDHRHRDSSTQNLC